ncbi:hypothetical protein G4G27_11855 [Sphingomonas sp. So64.6b]|uniref:hypothetical protein n=1 Tax=Sphingomonas sp. So64.6b TaxID=2997354 RepID=UPI0016042E39|nr:hypothetical protein [Sphingomonas sp. So64.6b]QNA84602.1 hypothetical protein G4G27_11855 [Sphingomonas sp. So64.6b]
MVRFANRHRRSWSMFKSHITRFPFSNPPQSLAWQDGALVDGVGGWQWLADGTEVAGDTHYAYGFDRALVSPSGRFSVLFCERQTKGIILDQGRLIREIGRSYYQASKYAYPIALGRLPDGREVLAHCPDAYNVIEIETLAEGERLTSRKGEAQDVFHSRLSFSPDGRFLLSAGWIWHPFNVFCAFDVEHALRDPASLDREEAHYGALEGAAPGCEVHAACWLDADRVVVTADEDDGDPSDGPPQSGIWSARDGRWISRTSDWNPQATLFPCAGGVAYVEHGHPHWWAPGLDTALAWPEIAVAAAPDAESRTGIKHDCPLFAAHPTARRFAAVTGNEIVVVDFEQSME